ncbi:MAG: hypothetical protein KF832_27305 [Caldilineaceae bacterium]|nr:hypothetical protein [Caldilineaceae bacterium]
MIQWMNQVRTQPDAVTLPWLRNNAVAPNHCSRACEWIKVEIDVDRSAQDEIKQQLRAFLAGYLPKTTIRDDEDLLIGGFMSSSAAMQLVLQLEQLFQVQFDNEDLVLENFRTLAAIAALIERRREL